MIRSLLILILLTSCSLYSAIKVGADILFEKEYDKTLLKGKRIGLISNQTAINRALKTTLDLLLEHRGLFQIVALFAPEHGYYGDAYAYENVYDHTISGIPLYSLHGATRRPTPEMLANIEVLLYDIQDIGSRSYTYISTLFYCMEEAAKQKIKFIVLDRPDPMGGQVVDGFLLDEKCRSFLSYVNVPYCHGMTIGELARFFNEEYAIGCDLEVIPMRGWKRGMTFHETGLVWVPTSPQIPDEETPFFYPTTGLLGHLSVVNIGIGYTLPFKLVGAPWIEADRFAKELNAQKLPGVYFHTYYFRPFFGKFKGENCQGVRIIITDPEHFLPITTQYTILGVLKNQYPEKVNEAIAALQSVRYKLEAFHKLNGTTDIFQILMDEKYFIWKLRDRSQKDRERFLPIRKKYLNPEYS